MTYARKWTTAGFGAGLSGLMLAAGCSSQDMSMLSASMQEEVANAAYTASYNGNASYSPSYGYGYSGPYWSPRTFGSYSGWPANYTYGDFVGYNQCRHTGSFYTCDTNGDGLADSYGDAEDGSYASSSLRVNGRGEAFTWGNECGCWQRNRAYDGPRKPDEVIIHDDD
ncbi:hypothetical protein [Henriciella aquimarina]|uniref:hypothetical protein n=1 Tax=Henriciella aquimarina TaxID=545261 RepID=UPI00117A0018|nr:hypothetical protein [Henriciella aquimarina]